MGDLMLLSVVAMVPCVKIMSESRQPLRAARDTKRLLDAVYLFVGCPKESHHNSP